MTHRDRHCPRWFRYKPGLGPHEHYREFHEQQVESERRRFEERLEAERRSFEEKLEEDRRNWEQEQTAAVEMREKSTNRLFVLIALIGIGLGAIEVLTAIFGGNPTVTVNFR